MREGWQFPCHPVALNFGYRTQIEKPDEAAEFDSFLAEITPGIVLLDVGAHFGIFSIAALHFGGPNARAIAVEPSPAAAAVMMQQAALLKASERLTVFRGCCAAKNGTREFLSTAFSSSRQFVPARDKKRRDRTAVPSMTIDSLVEHYRITPSHVKIDVEGCEHDVLLGASNTLAEYPGPVVFLELHNVSLRNMGIDPTDTLGLLISKGYSIDPRSAASDALKQPVCRIILRKVQGAQ